MQLHFKLQQKECKRSPGVSISFSSSCKVAHFFFNCTCARFERLISTFGLLYTSSGTNWKVVQSTKPRSTRKHVATLMVTICIARTAGIPHATATRKMRSKCPSSTMVYGCKSSETKFAKRESTLFSVRALASTGVFTNTNHGGFHVNMAVQKTRRDIRTCCIYNCCVLAKTMSSVAHIGNATLHNGNIHAVLDLSSTYIDHPRPAP